jgi:hypothetical protein
MISNNPSPGAAVQSAAPARSDGTGEDSSRVTQCASRAARWKLGSWFGVGFHHGRSDPTLPDRPGLRYPGW